MIIIAAIVVVVIVNYHLFRFQSCCDAFPKNEAARYIPVIPWLKCLRIMETKAE